MRTRRTGRSVTATVALAAAVLIAGSCASAEEDLVAQARAAKARGDIAGAIAILERGLAAHPDNAAAHYVAAWLYLQRGQREEAIAAFRRTVQLAPGSPDAREAEAALARLGSGAGAPAGPAVPPTALPGPRPGAKPPSIVVDKRRLCLMIGGEPFFPVGTSLERADMAAEAAGGGLNVLIHWQGPGAEGARYLEALSRGEREARAFVRGYLDVAAQAGVWVIEAPVMWAHGAGAGLLYADPAFTQNVAAFLEDPLPRVIPLVSDHPALLGYYGFDEPNGETHRQPAADFARALRAADPRHPLYLLFGNVIEQWPEACDVIGADWYPSPGETPLYAAYCGTKANAEAAHALGRPYWHMPLMEIRDAFRPPMRADEQRAQTYLSLVAGVNGIIWWTSLPRQAELWATVQQLTGEIRRLTPVLTEPPATTRVSYSPPSLSNTVQARAIRHGEHMFVIAANACDTPATVSFTLPAAASRAQVWFEDRSLPISERRFSDTFEGYGRRVYEINATWSPEGEISMAISLNPGGAAAAGPHVADPHQANVLPNPGFETDAFWHFDPADDSADHARGSMTEAEAHSGRRCATISRAGAHSRSRWVGEVIDLKPNTRYVFGGWVRAETIGNTVTGMRLQSTRGGDYIWGATSMQVPNRGPWRQFSTVFSTRDEAEHVMPVCLFTDGNDTAKTPGADGEAWFDDLFVIEAAATRNLVPNGGFEGPEWAPGWPRWWACVWSVEVPGHIGGDASLWGLDETTAHEGKRSLRLRNPGRPETLDPRSFPKAESFLARGTRLLAGHTYVLSLYMKADRERLPVSVTAGNHGYTKDLYVGREWQRYVARMDCKENSDSPFVGVVLGQEGTVWVDAVQFEEGAEPTDYEELRE